MVSTRGPKFKFAIGEKVLCYEPDLTKAKVLYDSKVMAIIEAKDKRTKKVIEYLIHFQGWNSSWDRRVNEDFVLKDTDENRQLQKDLAEKSQLQIGAYLYRKEQKKRMRHRSGSSTESKLRYRGSSEDGSSCSTQGGRDFGDDTLMPEVSSPQPVGSSGATSSNANAATAATSVTTGDIDTESYSSSVESANEDDRVYLQIGDQLKAALEHDWNMITKCDRLVNLPAKIPVITILENFVKHYSIKAISCPTQLDGPRRRNSSAKVDKREKDYEKLSNSINLRKEVADGLRVYFDFTLKDYLLYKQEREQANALLAEENLKNFTYIASERQALDIAFKQETPKPCDAELPESFTTSTESTAIHAAQADDSSTSAKRRLRSYKTEESEFIFDIGLSTSAAASAAAATKDSAISSVASTSSGSSTPQAHQLAMSNINILKSILPPNVGITSKAKEILQNILAWQILPSDAPPQPSMIYGAVHLARLIVKLPDFLNSTSMADNKLKILLKYLDSFIEFLESHKEWFGEHQYKDAASTTPTTSTTSPPSLTTMSSPPPPPLQATGTVVAAAAAPPFSDNKENIDLCVELPPQTPPLSDVVSSDCVTVKDDPIKDEAVSPVAGGASVSVDESDIDDGNTADTNSSPLTSKKLIVT